MKSLIMIGAALAEIAKYQEHGNGKAKRQMGARLSSVFHDCQTKPFPHFPSDCNKIGRKHADEGQCTTITLSADIKSVWMCDWRELEIFPCKSEV